MKLYSMRRLIRSDFAELLAFVCVTRKKHGTMRQSDLLRYFERGKIIGLFENGQLFGAAFVGRVGAGLIVDGFLHGTADRGSQSVYLRLHDSTSREHLQLLIEFWEKERLGKDSFLLLHYDYIKDISVLLVSDDVELVALRTIVGVKPGIVLHSTEKAAVATRFCSDYKLCNMQDSKTLGMHFDSGYTGVSAVGCNVILCRKMC